MNLANRLTCLRLLLIPFIVTFLIYSYIKGSLLFRYIAMCLFLISALTDVIDGFIARHWGRVGELGRFLDPLADKLLVSTIFVILTMGKEVPIWVATIVISRDLILGIGFGALYILTNKKTAMIKPTPLGKTVAFVQMFTLFLLLFDTHRNWDPYLRYPMYIMVILTILSIFEYTREGVRQKNGIL